MPSRGMGGHARRRRARRRHRDWADGLGVDALLAILRRLDHADVLRSAQHVCRSWRRVARDEPTLWRRITMRGHERTERWLNRGGGGGAAIEAVRRSAGKCEAFCGEYAGDNRFLIYLSEQAPCLKSLRLISCNHVTDLGISDAVKQFPLLEELELSLCANVGSRELYEFVGEVCPKLKHFRLRRRDHFNGERRRGKMDARGIASMHGLRSLQLLNSDLNNTDLEAILDNCPNLEFLDIRHCFKINMVGTLHLKCARIKTVYYEASS
ncbi:hypothetical protein U9M48_040490 [Paspalum notatum var. saurae]|uniref:F-box domain-containing protein n=1 Tax=Paspalum notatum var. saurae TaxID=547442 RepID=A0AAQ3UM73_PASNO